MSENSISRREALKRAGWSVPVIMAITLPASASAIVSPDGTTTNDTKVSVSVSLS